MNTTTATKTRGVVQIVRNSEKVWSCSITFYGESVKLKSVHLNTRKVIDLLRCLGAPAPVTGKDSHVIEFYNAPRWNQLKDFGFFVLDTNR